jgi:DNA-binding NtrC family response regulator
MALNTNILVVDDDSSFRKSIKLILQDAGYPVIESDSPQRTRALLEKHSPDIALCDLMMPEKSDGLDLISLIKQKDDTIQVLAITQWASIEYAVDAMKAGADDFVVKGCKEEELLLKIDRLIKNRAQKINLATLEATTQNLQKELEQRELFYEIVGSSKPMKQVKLAIARIAANRSATCLVLGETGTGKELVARHIHRLSARCDKPFIALNCAGIPANLMESELFGHEKGAFTGAHRTRIGKLEMANGGTFFLDEIGDMPVELQAKLLRFLDDQKINRVGGVRDIELDLRIIAATNAKLEELIRLGKFREDLFYRLNVVQVKLPPLREREGDIDELVHHFCDVYTHKYGQPVQLQTEAMLLLQNYHFPGNVRELSNIIEHAFLFHESGKITAQLIGSKLSQQPAAHSTPDERDLRETLVAFDWNITRAAKFLGYSREGLSRRIKRQGLKP